MSGKKPEGYIEGEGVAETFYVYTKNGKRWWYDNHCYRIDEKNNLHIYSSVKIEDIPFTRVAMFSAGTEWILDTQGLGE